MVLVITTGLVTNGLSNMVLPSKRTMLKLEKQQQCRLFLTWIPLLHLQDLFLPPPCFQPLPHPRVALRDFASDQAEVTNSESVFLDLPNGLNIQIPITLHQHEKCKCLINICFPDQLSANLSFLDRVQLWGWGKPLRNSCRGFLAPALGTQTFVFKYILLTIVAEPWCNGVLLSKGIGGKEQKSL